MTLLRFLLGASTRYALNGLMLIGRIFCLTNQIATEMGDSASFESEFSWVV